MNNISTKIDLLKIKGAMKTELDGKKGKVKVVVLPIEYANLYEGEKGVYLDLIGFPLRNPDPSRKDTHLVKQSLPKEKQRDDDPILGSHIQWGAAPQQAVSQTPAEEAEEASDDDVPF